MRITGVTNPAQLARAYGAEPVAKPAPIRQSQTAGRIDQVNRVERSINTRAAKLIAGVVPGGISFESEPQVHGSAAASSEGVAKPAETMPFYRRPADRNVAATAIHIGQRLDATG